MKVFKRQIITIFIMLFLLTFSTLQAQTDDTEGFDSEKVFAELEEKMNLSKEQWEKLKPVLEEKSREMSKNIDESVDKGFAELDKLSKQFQTMTEDAEKKLDEIVSSEEAQKIRDYLAKIDKEAIDEAKDKMVADLNALLDLSEEQAKKIQPVIEKSINELNAMIQGLAAEGSRNWNDFKKDLEELKEDIYDKVQDTLDDEQMKKFEEYNDKQEEKIERTLFRV